MQMAHKIADALRQAGVPDAVVNEVRDTVEDEMSALAAKHDLADLKADLKQFIKESLEAMEKRIDESVSTKIAKANSKIIMAGIAIAALAVAIIEYLK